MSSLDRTCTSGLFFTSSDGSVGCWCCITNGERRSLLDLGGLDEVADALEVLIEVLAKIEKTLDDRHRRPSPVLLCNTAASRVSAHPGCNRLPWVFAARAATPATVSPVERPVIQANSTCAMLYRLRHGSKVVNESHRRRLSGRYNNSVGHVPTMARIAELISWIGRLSLLATAEKGKISHRLIFPQVCIAPRSGPWPKYDYGNRPCCPQKLLLSEVVAALPFLLRCQTENVAHELRAVAPVASRVLSSPDCCWFSSRSCSPGTSSPARCWCPGKTLWSARRRSLFPTP